ncbi:uncharacterized protein FYW49_008616 [Xenentodon cancila]
MWLNETLFIKHHLPEAEKWLLVVVLVVEMVMGVVGNSFALLIKMLCRDQFRCRYWLPFLSLTLSDLGCSLLITSASILAILREGQSSPWCEVVSLLKFTFFTSSIGSIAILCVQRLIGITSTRNGLFGVMVTGCLSFWLTGFVFGSISIVFTWIRYDPAEMLCTVFWESSYLDMKIYVLCALSICIFFPLLLIFVCSVLRATIYRPSDSDEQSDLSEVAPVLVASYMICYTPFVVSELILLCRMDLTPAPDWLRTLSSVMSYLDCGLNPLIYYSNCNFREVGLALLWTKRKPVSEPILTVITETIS